jgi:DNA polymerase
MTRSPSNLFIDIETYSHINLKKCGYFRYAEKASLLLFAYSYGQEIHVIDVKHGEAVPLQVIQDINDPSVQKWAHNAAFEITVLTHLGYATDCSQWRCSMVLARYLALPASLDELGKALNVEHKKLATGKKLIQKFCTPSRYKTTEEEWVEFKQYCEYDVRATIEIVKALHSYDNVNIWQEWCLDQKINTIGLPIDEKFTSAASVLADMNRLSVIESVKKETGLANPNSRNQVLAYLRQEIDAPNLTKKTVTELLKQSNLSDKMRFLLVAREQMSKSSLRKFESLLNAKNEDGRLRGAFAFYGSRTGRWAGRVFQPQNLPRPILKSKSLEVAREIVKRSSINVFNMLYDDVSGVLSSLIRTCIAAEIITVADYHGIESVMAGWLSGCETLLQLYRTDKDPYIDLAAIIYKKAYEKVTKEERQTAKPCFLGGIYGLGANGLVSYAQQYRVDIPVRAAKEHIDALRKRYKEIPAMWYAIEKSVSEAMASYKRIWVNERVSFSRDANFLKCHLPSDRILYYYKPEYHEEGLTYIEKTRKYTYGARLFENIVQAISRDILVNGLFNTDRAGMKIIGHVHDEIMVEGDCLQELVKAMTTNPKWCDAPITADGYTGKYYSKGG